MRIRVLFCNSCVEYHDVCLAVPVEIGKLELNVLCPIGMTLMVQHAGTGSGAVGGCHWHETLSSRSIQQRLLLPLLRVGAVVMGSEILLLVAV